MLDPLPPWHMPMHDVQLDPCKELHSEADAADVTRTCIGAVAIRINRPAIIFGMPHKRQAIGYAWVDGRPGWPNQPTAVGRFGIGP